MATRIFLSPALLRVGVLTKVITIKMAATVNRQTKIQTQATMLPNQLMPPVSESSLITAAILKVTIHSNLTKMSALNQPITPMCDIIPSCCLTISIAFLLYHLISLQRQ